MIIVVLVLVALGLLVFFKGFSTRNDPQAKRYGFVTGVLVVVCLVCFGISTFLIHDGYKAVAESKGLGDESRMELWDYLTAHEDEINRYTPIRESKLSERRMFGFGFAIIGGLLLLLTPVSKTTLSQDQMAGGAMAVVAGLMAYDASKNNKHKPYQ